MVALSEKLCRNDTRPQCGRRSRKGRFGRYSNSSAASESSVNAVAGNYPNGTTDSLWQGWQTMEERNPFGGSGSTDTPIKQFIWGTYIDECIQLNLLVAAGPQGLPAGAYYLLQDLLYRAAALTNSSGSIVEAYDTDAYGNTLIFTAPGADGVWFTDDDVQSNYGANSIIYCGYRYDPETENYYVRNRCYSPVLGRWVTRDPIGYAGGINVYEYTYDNPAVGTDPSGRQSPGIALEEAIAAGNVQEVETILDAVGDVGVLSDEQIAAARAFLAKDAKCLAIYAAYKALDCRGCRKCTTEKEALANIACLTAEIAGRTAYVKLECDYVLAGSIIFGSAKKETGHKKEIVEKTVALAKCVAKAAILK